mmetsp:Transcript_35534/g.75787  ORF Transcript_35534/g.75787 Transcript_35534/m.75787 type:complete len:150 (-) Transcript_35534:350-799(-)
MSRGEYEFPILVVCLLILGLQIHNPFQTKPVCECSGGATRPGVEAAYLQQHGMMDQHPPVYRKAAQAPAAGSSAGLSSGDLLKELESIQRKAKDQQDTLTAAGKMPPASPILQQIKQAESLGRGPATPPIPQAVPSGWAQPPAFIGQEF